MGYNFVKVVIFWNLKHLWRKIIYFLYFKNLLNLIIHLYSFVSLKEFKLLNDIYGQWIFSYFFLIYVIRFCKNVILGHYT